VTTDSQPLTFGLKTTPMHTSYEQILRHIVFGVRPPAPDNVARWLADEIINPVLEIVPGG
jgi:hypothetical protein